MRKVSMSLEEGNAHKKVGLAIYGYDGEAELRKIVDVIEKSLTRSFPGVEISHQRAVRELLGE